MALIAMAIQLETIIPGNASPIREINTNAISVQRRSGNSIILVGFEIPETTL
jgi:hypothetical protein